jgi:hypothetical protein
MALLVVKAFSGSALRNFVSRPSVAADRAIGSLVLNTSAGQRWAHPKGSLKMLYARFFYPAIGMITFGALVGGNASAAEPEPTPEARAHFKIGVAYLESGGRYDEAYREFKAAYAVTPRWTILGNLGIAADHLERDGEALDAFESYLARGADEIRKGEVEEVRRDIERLRSGIATVRVSAPGSFWVVDTRTGPDAHVVNEYGPFNDGAELRVRAGEHSFELTRAGAKTPSWSVTLLAGDIAMRSFAVTPVETFQSAPSEPVPAPPAIDRRSHTTAYILWGIGALAVGASTILYVESRGYQNKADNAFPTSCPDGADRDDYQCSGALADDARAANLRTAALLTGLGALGALVGGTVLYALDLQSTSDRGITKEANLSVPSLRAWVSPKCLGISGNF